MNDFKQFLSLEEKQLNWKIVGLLILIAYAFNIAVRYIYISYVGDVPSFQWNGHLMINNNDGYYWAEGARDILAGHHQPNDGSPVTYPASILTAAIAKFLPFIPFDVLIEYLPGFLGSLVVIPVVLIGRVLGSTWMGFLAGLMSGMVWSYYHRTMFGYYDTDMLVITLSVFALWAIIWSLKTKDKRFFFIAPLIEVLMIEWHGGLFNVANGFFIMSAIYVAIFSREKNSILFLILLTIPALKIALIYKTIIIIAIYFGILKFEKEINIKYLLGGVVIGYLVVVGVPWIYHTLNNSYFTRAVTTADEGFKYFSVVNTVSEASHISFDTLVHRISGSFLGFVLGLIGYILLSIRYPIILISLPMVVLGLFAVRGGLRFTIFAVPFFALGNAYVAYLFGKLSYKLFINDKVAKISVYAVSFLVMLGFIYPNYKHIHKYIMPVVFDKNEVAVLDKLKTIANRDDYVLTWWDYGYPIRYYSDVKTLADGARHSGETNFPVSFALTRDLIASKNMAVLDVYANEKSFQDNKHLDVLKYFMKQYDFKNINDFLEYLDTNINLPKIKEDVYYFLPLRMMNIFPTVAIFSTIDLKTGKRQKHLFLQTQAVKKEGNFVLLNNGIKLDLAKANIIMGKQVIPIKRFAITNYDKAGKLHKVIKNIHSNGLNVIYMKSYGKWLIMDDFYFNSAYIQLFVFENNAGLFEEVIKTPFVKVYKVKK